MTDLFQPTNTPTDLAHDEELIEEAVRNLMRHSTLEAGSDAGNPIRDTITHWLGCDPTLLPGFSDDYYGYLHINVQAALDAFLSAPGRESTIIGIHAPSSDYRQPVPFSKLLANGTFGWSGAASSIVDYQMKPCGWNEFMPCLERGLILFRDAEGLGVIWLNHTEGYHDALRLEVLTAPAERAPKIIDELRELSVERSPYKGQMFRIRFEMGQPVPEFMRRPARLTADDIILPEGVLERIDQHTIKVARTRKTLEKLGLHLKRGILLHGPPGTGKTHIIRYLASQMTDSTVVVLPKTGVAAVRELLVILEPAVIVLDDIDLVAENRAMPGMTSRAFLFEVLETLDGIRDKGDVLFVLTTNRIDTMEPAIAARPGRVDQSIEIPRPDASARRRLFHLYAKGVDLQATEADIDRVLERTAGVTASFFKELLRRATVKAVKDGGPIDEHNRVPVTADVLQAVLDRMLDPANPMTRILLGAQPDHGMPGIEATEA